MDNIPLYQKIVESIRKQTLIGQLQPGDRLPSVRQMTVEWDCTPGTVQRPYQELVRQGLALTLLVGAAFNADGTQLAAGGVGGQVLAWTLSTGTMRVIGPQSTTPTVSAGIQSMEFSPDGRQLATAGLDGSVVIWNPDTGERLATLMHDEPVLALAYGGGDGRAPSLASVDSSGIARVWDPTTFALRREIKSYSAPLNTTAFSRDGRFLVTAGKDLSVWEADTGARMQLIADHGNLYAAAMSANGQRIAVGGRGGFLALLDCDVCVPIDQLL